MQTSTTDGTWADPVTGPALVEGIVGGGFWSKMMSDFLAAQAAGPFDLAAMLILADWHEERGISPWRPRCGAGRRGDRLTPS